MTLIIRLFSPRVPVAGVGYAAVGEIVAVMGSGSVWRVVYLTQ